MAEIIVVSQEPLIARMLCLEAERIGLHAETLPSLPQTCDAELIIADYDRMTEEERERCASPIGQHCFLLYGEGEIPEDAGAARFERPFLVEALFSAVKERLASKAPSDTSAASGITTLEVTSAGIALGGNLLSLTKREEAILLCLLAHRGETVTRETLCREIWGERQPRNNSLEVYIGHLRRKTEERGGSRVIVSVHGVGYRID